MKRPAKLIGGAVSGPILTNYSQPQLALIGSIAVAYNGCEQFLHHITGLCLGLYGKGLFVTSRINGTDGLIAITVQIAKAYPSLGPDVHAAISQTLSGDGFSLLKKYRDAVIHSVPLNQSLQIGRYRGKQASEADVLLSEEALGWVTDNLVSLHSEMEHLARVIKFAWWLAQKGESAERVARHEEALRSAIPQYLEAQRLRRKIRKPPKFQ